MREENDPEWARTQSYERPICVPHPQRHLSSHDRESDRGTEQAERKEERESACKSLHHLISHCILWIFFFLYIESVDLNTWTQCAGVEWGGWITYSSSLLSHKGKNRMIWITPLFLLVIFMRTESQKIVLMSDFQISKCSDNPLLHTVAIQQCAISLKVSTFYWLY